MDGVASADQWLGAYATKKPRNAGLDGRKEEGLDQPRSTGRLGSLHHSLQLPANSLVGA